MRDTPRMRGNGLNGEISEMVAFGHEGEGIAGVEAQLIAAAVRHRRAAPRDFRLQCLRRPKIVEANVEARVRICRNDIRRRIADIDGENFEMAWIETL